MVRRCWWRSITHSRVHAAATASCEPNSADKIGSTNAPTDQNLRASLTPGSRIAKVLVQACRRLHFAPLNRASSTEVQYGSKGLSNSIIRHTRPASQTSVSEKSHSWGTAIMQICSFVGCRSDHSTHVICAAALKERPSQFSFRQRNGHWLCSDQRTSPIKSGLDFDSLALATVS